MSVNQEKIWHIVSQIPRGKVATYGQVAELAGLPGRARLVGQVLSNLPAGSLLPWHRVVNSRGRLSFPQGSGRYAFQQQRLEAEGISFESGRFPLRRYRWRI